MRLLGSWTSQSTKALCSASSFSSWTDSTAANYSLLFTSKMLDWTGRELILQKQNKEHKKVKGSRQKMDSAAECQQNLRVACWHWGKRHSGHINGADGWEAEQFYVPGNQPHKGNCRSDCNIYNNSLTIEIKKIKNTKKQHPRNNCTLRGNCEWLKNKSAASQDSWRSWRGQQ